MSEAIPQDRPPEEGVRRRLLRQPSKKKLDEELDSLLQIIKAKETEVKSLGRPTIETPPEEQKRKNRLIVEQKTLKDRQRQTITKRREVEDQIKGIQNELTKKGDGLSRLEASLPYKSQNDLEKAINRLEYQLNTKHFKLSEENRIVREIDTLKRSRKNVVEYVQKKKEIEYSKAQREKLRDERTKYYNEVSSLKSKEDDIKHQLTTLKGKEDVAWDRYREGGPRREELKKEINELYEKRRQIIAEFHRQQQEYKKEIQEVRAEEYRRREEEKKAKDAAVQKAWAEYEASREPYEEERQTAAALIKYLHTLQGSEEESNTPSPRVRELTTSVIEEESGAAPEYTILRRKGDSDDDLFLSGAASSRKKKMGKRQRRHSGHHNKTIRHSHQIFMQFQSLSTKPPSTHTEVTTTLHHLQEKLEQYQMLATLEKSAAEVGSRESEAALSDASGVTSDIQSVSASSLMDEELENLSIGESTTLADDDSIPLSKDEGVHSLSSNSTGVDLEGNGDLLESGRTQESPVNKAGKIVDQSDDEGNSHGHKAGEIVDQTLKGDDQGNSTEGASSLLTLNCEWNRDDSVGSECNAGVISGSEGNAKVKSKHSDIPSDISIKTEQVGRELSRGLDCDAAINQPLTSLNGIQDLEQDHMMTENIKIVSNLNELEKDTYVANETKVVESQNCNLIPVDTNGEETLQENGGENGLLSCDDNLKIEKEKQCPGCLHVNEGCRSESDKQNERQLRLLPNSDQQNCGKRDVPYVRTISDTINQNEEVAVES